LYYSLTALYIETYNQLIINNKFTERKKKMAKIVKILQVSTEVMVLVLCGLELRDAIKKIKEERKHRSNLQPSTK